MRRFYHSFLVQAWVDETTTPADRYRFKVEHVQSQAVVVVTELDALLAWLQQQWNTAPAWQDEDADAGS
jgi:hypothetical protein